VADFAFFINLTDVTVLYEQSLRFRRDYCGGGPAGSSAANIWTKAGGRVLLAERRNFRAQNSTIAVNLSRQSVHPF